MALHHLPYDLLLCISEFLGEADVCSLQYTCKSLYAFANTRPVVRNLAVGLLQRCRPLPLRGFQCVADLPTVDLKRSVHRAAKLERAWRVRGPRAASVGRDDLWYRVVNTPPGEEVEWLSPITMSYMLCSTKSGKVMCWDVESDTCLGMWDPGQGWVLWKCRAAYEEQSVYFTMGKDISEAQDDNALELDLMKLHIPEDRLAPKNKGNQLATNSEPTHTFQSITKFKTSGLVLNVFILNHTSRIMSAYIWLTDTNTIGLYVVPDWDQDDYTFIDTTISCHPLANWSCVYYDDKIVILCEEATSTTQYFYPIPFLLRHCPTLKSMFPEPIRRTGSAPPSYSHKCKFIFPAVTMSFGEGSPSATSGMNIAPLNGASLPSVASASSSNLQTSVGYPNPCPGPPWYPDSAHFVRQWWPAVPNMPHISCTVVLLGAHDPTTHRTAYTLAQHYLMVATSEQEEVGEGRQSHAPGMELQEKGDGDVKEKDNATKVDDDSSLKIWYSSQPFEIVCITDSGEEQDDAEAAAPNYRPLIAVDFGHAVWVEYEDDERQLERKVLRFVTFPAVDADPWDNGGMAPFVSTLEVPDDLDLGCVETLNIDQSQGAVIISVREGKVFILFYE